MKCIKITVYQLTCSLLQLLKITLSYSVRYNTHDLVEFNLLLCSIVAIQYNCDCDVCLQPIYCSFVLLITAITRL